MAKDPAFLFYPGDWLSGTMGMTFEEKGAYFELLMFQFNRGHMTDHMAGQVVGQLWVKVRDKFIQDQKGLWYNVRLDEEKEKRKNFVNSRKNNIKGKNQYSKSETKMTGHMTKHMENENIDVLFNTSIAKILNKKYEAGADRGITGAGRDVDSLIEQMKFAGQTEAQILEQAKAMRAYYQLKDWPMPTNYIKLLSAITENDWPQKLKDEDPERKSEQIQKAIKDANRKQPEVDTIGSSAPGSLG